jgi:hypothetical protein
MNELLQLDTAGTCLQVITAIVTGASVIAAITPTPKPKTRLARVYKLIDILALNVLKAKQK